MSRQHITAINGPWGTVEQLRAKAAAIQRNHDVGNCRIHAHHAIHKLTRDGWTKIQVPAGCSCLRDIEDIYVSMAKIRLGVE